ncbi:polysaccharide biosynthesis C-terminal domain-containing protein [Photobacterium proteolyticum]|nr:polysaccharide biosynthesis C-terminal domain-containing protein [Photobacterium proteolyticum]
MYINIEVYGMYTYSIAIFMFFMMLSRLGLDTYLQREVSSGNTSGNIAVGQVSVISVISTIVTGSVYLFFSGTEYETFWVFFLLSAFFFNASWIYSYILKGAGYIKEAIAIYEVGLPLINISSILLLGRFLDGTKLLLLSFLISMLITFLLLLAFLYKRRVVTKFEIARPKVSESYGFSLISISTMLLVMGDTYLIGILLSDYDVGVYTLTTKIGMFILLPTSVITTFLNNKISKNIGNVIAIKNLIVPSIILNGVIVSIFGMIIYILSPLILDFLSVSSDEAVIVLMLLKVYVVAQIMMGMSGIFESVLIMGGGQNDLFKINSLMVIINLILGYLFITAFGLIGAVYSTLISCIICRILQVYIVNKKVFTVNVSVN